jgi:LPXTG-motif cell wall-anchored protein
MQASTRAFFKRGGAACAAAAVLIGGTFSAGAASATTAEPSAEPTSTISATATAATGTELPTGLPEAVKRDLGLSMAEYNARGELAAKAAAVQAEVAKTDPKAAVSIAGDTIKVKTTAPKAAKAAAGTTKIAITTAKAAPAPAKADATSVDALFDAYVAKFGVGNLQSVMETADGKFVIRTGDAATTAPSATARSLSASTTISAEKFADAFGNVDVEHAEGPAKALANDVVDGQGYAAPKGGNFYGLCSIGWNGFNATGLPAVISAGHCTDDGGLKATILTVPSQDAAGKPAAGGTALGAALGTFGFSQFGGKNNSPATGVGTPNPGNVGTDVSVIDGINPSLNQLPFFTDWTKPANLAASGTKVTGVSTAVNGAPICKSGRTSGWSCGTVDGVGIFTVIGVHATESDPDVRAVRGFASIALRSDHGDSGGPVISGSAAVGITSAGPEDRSVSLSADLKTALAATPGYSVKIFLNAPTLTTPVNNGTAFRSSTITGKVAGAPAGTQVIVTIEGGEPVTGDVAANGTWTVTAPSKFGEFKFTAQAKNGFSTSASSAFTVNIIKQTLAAPAITTPSANASVPGSVSAISGTGKAGATVTVTVDAAAANAAARAADVTGTAVVDANGKWTVQLPQALALGSHTVVAAQTLTDWNDSKPVTSSFKVVPAAPAITSVASGHQFPAGQGPLVISGTNLAGATVDVTINGTKYAADVVDGTWKVEFSDKLASGKYTVSAIQTIDGLTSPATALALTVLAPPAPPATQKPTPAPTTPAATTAPAVPATTPAMQAPAGNGDLANTGTSGTLLTLGAAGGVLLLGGVAFLLFRRRSASHQ